MKMTSRQYKFLLICHITFSVGWLGSVAVFIALGVTGIASKNVELARASYLVMDVTSLYVIVPFCLGALLTGLIQALGTKWGLFRHYWIVVKLILTVASTALLLMHLKPIRLLSEMAAEQKFPDASMYGLRMRIVADAGAGLLVLIAILVISVYKPWGRIKGTLNMQTIKKSRAKYIVIGIIVLVLCGIILLHLLGGEMHGAGGHQMKMSMISEL